MISVSDLAWTAGFLEGEGSFTFNQRSPVVTAAQVQKQPLDKLRQLFGGALSLSRRIPKLGARNNGDDDPLCADESEAAKPDPEISSSMESAPSIPQAG